MDILHRELIEENERMRETLKFYADGDNYKLREKKFKMEKGMEYSEYYTPVMSDFGQKARATLDTLLGDIVKSE